MLAAFEVAFLIRAPVTTSAQRKANACEAAPPGAAKDRSPQRPYFA